MARWIRGSLKAAAVLTVAGTAIGLTFFAGQNSDYEIAEQPKDREQVSIDEGRVATANRTDAFFFDTKSGTVAYVQLLRGESTKDGRALATSAMCVAKFADLDKQVKVELNPGPHFMKSAVKNLVPTDGTKPMCDIASVSAVLSPPTPGKTAGRDNQDAAMIAVNPNESGEKADAGFGLFQAQADEDAPVTMDAQSSPGSITILANYTSPNAETIGVMSDRLSAITAKLRDTLESSQLRDLDQEQRRAALVASLRDNIAPNVQSSHYTIGQTQFPRAGAQLNSDSTPPTR
ncbi:MAG: hypothetical protein HOQ05_03540 [Corynebacteriales bacterium]|nr:hypothetical protein [Mycobacteriales bacterium]